MNIGKIIFIIVLLGIGVGGMWWWTRSTEKPSLLQYSDTTQPLGTASTTNNETSMNTLSPEIKKSKATLTTNRGVITFEFFSADAPNTVANFISLAQKGFYNGVRFHRVIKGFMIQGGDPLSKDDANISRWGTGGPGYQFADELNPNTQSFKTGYKKGVVAMANAGPNTNGSQFFIMLEDYPLPNNYTIFGRVVAGQDVVDAIGVTPTDQNDRPKSAVTIEKVEIQ